MSETAIFVASKPPICAVSSEKQVFHLKSILMECCNGFFALNREKTSLFPEFFFVPIGPTVLVRFC
jgi:hypothetical protein